MSKYRKLPNGGSVLWQSLPFVKPPAPTSRPSSTFMCRPDWMRPAEIDLSPAVRIWERIQQYPSYSLYLAVQGDEVVGTLALLIMDNLAHHGRPSGILEDMAVNPAHQRQGIGKAMLSYAMGGVPESRVLQAVLIQQSKTRGRPPVLRRAGFPKARV